MRLPPTFSPLRHRNYRLYFTGQFFSLLGGWMQDTGRAWLVTLLATQVAPTHAEAERLASYYLGMLLTVGSLPMLFGSLFGGVIADRVSKKKLIFWSQSVQMLLSLAMAALVATGKAQVSHVFLFAILMGLTMIVDMPARQAFVVELVGKEDLPSAGRAELVALQRLADARPGAGGNFDRGGGRPGRACDRALLRPQRRLVFDASTRAGADARRLLGEGQRERGRAGATSRGGGLPQDRRARSHPAPASRVLLDLHRRRLGADAEPGPFLARGGRGGLRAFDVAQGASGHGSGRFSSRRWPAPRTGRAY